MLARRRPTTTPRTPPPGTAAKSVTAPNPSSSTFARRTIAAPSGCSLARSTRPGEVEQAGVGPAGERRDGRDARPAERQGPGLVEDDGVDPMGRARAPRRRGSGCRPPRPRPVPTMIAVGVARPIAHGQAMTTTAMNEVRARVRRGSGPNSEPDQRRSPRAIDEDHRDEDLGDAVGQALDRCLAALRAPDQVDDAGERRVATDSGRAQHERAGRVEGRADDLVARRRPRPGSARRSASTHRSTRPPRGRRRRPGRDRRGGPGAGRRPRPARAATSASRPVASTRLATVALEADEPADGAGRAGLGATSRASGRAGRGQG